MLSALHAISFYYGFGKSWGGKWRKRANCINVRHMSRVVKGNISETSKSDPEREEFFLLLPLTYDMKKSFSFFLSAILSLESRLFFSPVLKAINTFCN
jgi:hypothetical protein